MHYESGVSTVRVYGAICEKWVELGGDRGFGPPLSEERASARGRVSFFADGKAIYWSAATDAHEVHGLIAQTYWEAGGDASPLGLPISDEEPLGNGRVSRFEHGRIEWEPGDRRGRIIYA
jgi:lysozyme